ncbi:hypothetical protein TNCV_3709891 [Trichonephila clavipes]|nr:hypothetical protein TNCV_3709891 [Trichonephila clavipes]
MTQVGLQDDRWRHHLSPTPKFRHRIERGKYSPAPYPSCFLLRPPTGLTYSLINRARTPCVLRGYLMGSGTEPRPTSLEPEL